MKLLSSVHISRVRLLVCLTLAMVAGSGAVGQPAASSKFDGKEFLARSIARLAIIDLRAAAAPQETDFRIANLLLSLANETSPSDAEILRRKIEAAYSCGDDKSVLESTRALVLLDSKSTDTVAQLRLITSLIADKTQNAEDRLQVYEQFTADKRIDASIRSRLALDAAMLLRERGDDEAFRKKLALSCQLDSSHKEAAVLAAAVVAERRPDDAAGRFQALQNVLMADPLDPNIHFAICRELVNARAFKAARRFHENGGMILRIIQASTERTALESMVLQMHAEGPAALAETLNRQLAVAKDNVTRDLRAAEAANHPTEGMQKPEDVRLSSNVHSLYILALAAAGDTAAASASLTDLAGFVLATANSSAEAVKRGKLTPEQALKGTAELSIQLQLTRLITGLQVDQVRKDYGADSKILVERFPDAYKQIETWLVAREGNPDAAIPVFEEQATTNSVSLLGIAVCHELAAGRTPQAIEGYIRVLTDAPLDPAGAWARSRLLALGHKEAPGPIAAMEAAAARIPRWVDAMALEPERFLQLRVDVADPDQGGLDRTVLRISLQNLSDIPLGLGSDRPLSSRLLLSPKLEAINGGPINLARPEVVHLDRRLRLMPKETLEIDLWPDSGQCGWLMEALANRSIRVRWRAVQGFQADRRAGFMPGVMGLSTESTASVRRPLAEASLSPQSLAKEVTDGPINLIARTAAVMRANLVQPLLMPKVAEAPPAPVAPGAAPAAAPAPAAPIDPEVAMKPVADAFAARYPALGQTERCTLILTLPTARFAAVMQPVDQVMRADVDPVALCLVLATRVTDPKDELLTKCKESDDPRVREMAGLVAQRLAGTDLFYARWTSADISKRAAAAAEAAATGGAGAIK